MKRKYLVTGGTGFIGANFVKRLLKDGHEVRVLDNFFRDHLTQFGDDFEKAEMINGDIRDAAVVERCAKGCDSIVHMAYINGTEFFYSKPELVLEVAVKGMINILDACMAEDIRELILISSSEVYQDPPLTPTPEDVPLIVPDVHNPRYSYGGGKIISELLTINYGRAYSARTIIVRPHNVIGPRMGWEHVIPQFILRARRQNQKQPDGPLRFQIQGNGDETRAFVYIDDFIDGLILAIEKGENQGVYHIGVTDEVPIAEVAGKIVAAFGREIDLIPGELTPGSARRRCPDISKLTALGYRPKYSLDEALVPTIEWYVENAHAYGK